VEPEAARAIIGQLSPFVLTVGVFVDAESAAVRDLAAGVGLDWIQLHGSEPPDYCRALERRVIKAFRVQDESSLSELAKYRGAVQAFLLDTYKPGQVGGTGETFNWDLARQARQYGPIILAGGLNPNNVAQAIRTARPQAVDVASGVEASMGKKDPKKLRAFFDAVKGVGDQ
jgi:phosphoribosylanthranilate isomerase